MHGRMGGLEWGCLADRWKRPYANGPPFAPSRFAVHCGTAGHPTPHGPPHHRIEESTRKRLARSETLLRRSLLRPPRAVHDQWLAQHALDLTGSRHPTGP